MRMTFFTKQALPLPRGRFSRCANVATVVAEIKRISVAPDVAPNVAARKHHHVAFVVARNVAFEIAVRGADAESNCALNVASAVGSPLRWTFTHLLPRR
ncbi:MAG: hypothetical protein ACREDS_05610 [Limisphaerales bacterium]